MTSVEVHLLKRLNDIVKAEGYRLLSLVPDEHIVISDHSERSVFTLQINVIASIAKD